MHDRHRRAPMVHRDLALDHNVPDAPPPAGKAIHELEALQVDVTVRDDRSRSPLVDAKGNAVLADDQDRVDRGKSEHAPAWWPRRHHEQAVIPASPKARDSPHRITPEAIRHHPLALRRSIKVAA